MKRAIVLSGGGGKGAYQVGVWKALKKLHKKYDVVTGTSVGALNGAYMVQKDYKKAIHTWENIDYNTIFDEAGEIKQKKDILNLYIKGMVIDKGMKPTHLENLIHETVDEKKFRKSKVGYGLVTYNLSKMEPECLKKEQIKEGKLCDYLLASASCFPVFQKKQIEDQNYIDGGYYDNVPFELAQEFHVDEIIVVDLEAPGIKKKWNHANEKLIWIRPNNKLNSFLSFNANQSKRNICLGYNDTMKIFHKLDGSHFTFKKNQLHKNYRKRKEKISKIINHTFNFENQKKITLEKILSIEIFNILLQNNDEKEQEKIFNEIVEYVGICFEVEDSKIYSIASYHDALMKKISKDLIESNTKDKVKMLFYSKDRILKMYFLLFQKSLKDKVNLCTTAILHPRDFLAATYLYTIKNGSL